MVPDTVLQQVHRRDDAELAALGPATPLSADEVALVAEHWDAHPAKLVEACTRAHERTGDPVFLLAARRVLGR